MKYIILLTKEDIRTHKCGLHYEIRSGDCTINFSPEAIDELIKDYTEFNNKNTKDEIK